MITDYHHTQLDNGIDVVTIERPTESMMVAAVMRVGSAHETKEQAGLSHYLEHMAFKGTERHTGDEINEIVEVSGANVNAFTSNFETAYLFTGLREHESLGINTIAEIVLESNFPDEEIEKERLVIQQEMDQYEIDPSNRHSRVAYENIFPDQARGRPIIGYPDAINFSRDEIANWMKSHLVGENITLFQSGPLSHDSFTQQVNSLFSSLPRGTRSIPHKSNFAPETLSHTDDFGLDGQAIMSMMMPLTNTPNDDEYRIATRLSFILNGGMTSPLFRLIRENAGLCYGIDCNAWPDPDVSLFTFGTQCRIENVDRIRELITSELTRIANGEISQQDWTRSSNMVLNSVRLIREMDHMTVVQPLVHNFIHDGEMTTHDELVQKHLRVTRDDVIEMAQTLINAPVFNMVTT